ncbi:MAG TPA: SPOR domain-containing protein [Syntrophales bacterium]|nr:SPOR domain-containing protein [Syntrophales bacterium]
MAEGKPNEIDLEDELDSLYRKVSSADQVEKSVHPLQQAKAKASVLEAPVLHTGKVEKTQQAREARRFPVSRIVLISMPLLTILLIAIFFWPLIYHYDALSYDGKVYPLRINRITGKAAYFDGAVWLSPPIPTEIKINVPEPQAPPPAAPQTASPAAMQAVQPVVPPSDTKQVQGPPARPQPVAAAGKRAEQGYAIQIKSFPEDKRKAAEGLVDEMKKNLPDVRMETVAIKGRGKWHRILVGHFSTMKEASLYLQQERLSRVYRDSFVQKTPAGSP